MISTLKGQLTSESSHPVHQNYLSRPSYYYYEPHVRYTCVFQSMFITVLAAVTIHVRPALTGQLV